MTTALHVVASRIRSSAIGIGIVAAMATVAAVTALPALA